jgi:hypothetical protein
LTNLNYMNNIISIVSKKKITADYLMQQVRTMGTSSDAIDLFVRCITWNINNIDTNAVNGINTMSESVASYFLNTNILSLFLVLTKCGVKPDNMMVYLFELIKGHWEKTVETFVFKSRQGMTISISNRYRDEPYVYDGTEQPYLTKPDTFLVPPGDEDIRTLARNTSINKDLTFYPKEWPQMKNFRKTLLDQLKHLVTFSSSWVKPSNTDELITNFGIFLQNTMHISSKSVIYSEINNAFIDIVENCGTLVDYQLNGKGLDPLFMTFENENIQSDNRDVVNLNGKIFKYLREGYLDRWYAWASQWWLKDKHSKWFKTVHRMSHSDEHDFIKRTAEIMLVDECSHGASRFCMFGLTILNYPSLKYVRVFRKDDPWWKPPETIYKDISSPTAVKIDKGDLRTQLLVLKEYIEKLSGNVILYSTGADYLGFCVVNNIPLFIETIFGSAISIKTLREQIIHQTNIVGPLTKYVKEETRILTYVALMLISISHGIPCYVSFGWNNVLKQWFKIVKEHSVVGNRPESANKTCSWLARRVDNGIILNQPLLYVLFTRLLNYAFTPDKKVVKGDGSDGYVKYLKKHYNEMKEENRVGSGMVKPIDVMDMWNPFEKTFGNLSRMDTAGENITSMNNPERKREKKIKKIKEINDRINKLNGRDFQNEINTYKKEIELVEKQLKKVEEDTNDDSLIGTVTTYFSNNMYNKDVLKETLKFVKKQLESVMSDRVEASRQISSLREQLMNITNEPNSEPNIPEWNKDSVYAPFISK